MVDFHRRESLVPKKITLFADVTLERVTESFTFPQISQISLVRFFSGDFHGNLRLITDLNLSNLKKSQLGFVEGALLEAFNMLSQEFFFNLTDASNISLYRLPTQTSYAYNTSGMNPFIYKLNLQNGYCHCGIEITIGDNA